MSAPTFFSIKQERLDQTHPANNTFDGGATQHPNEIITIADRRVRVYGAGLENASIYTYCRQWTLNNPNPTYSGPTEEVVKLPAIQHPEPGPEQTPFEVAALDVGNDELTDLTEIIEKQKQRWKAAGEGMRKNAAEKRAPYVDRLNSAIQYANAMKKGNINNNTNNNQ